MYRSLNQSKDDFEKFCNKFELTVDALLATNSFLIVAIGDFNATGILATGISSNWYIGDTITFEGSKTVVITSQFGLQQTIMIRLTFKENLCPVLVLSSTLNQIW